MQDEVFGRGLSAEIISECLTQMEVDCSMSEARERRLKMEP